MDGLGRWSVDFYEMVGAVPFAAEEESAWFGDVHERAEDFQARAKAQESTPTAMQELADANRTLKAEAAELRTDLAEERSRSKVMRRIIAEPSLELEQAKAELGAAAGVARLPVRTGPSGTVRRD
ncbi:hypothetical protein AB0K43_08275 [Kitasatospora sp. NPDC049258]|uniref:hypothetical protein n=1 Tax=Kitasatospora sp. NPDC049258 TaxID=3155394 RepID=UPI0034413984